MMLAAPHELRAGADLNMQGLFIEFSYEQIEFFLII